jgi:hypothetical protein
MTTSVTSLKEGLPPLPERMRALKIDERGYPVPWFVAWVEGQPDFRCFEEERLFRAVTEKRCWACGETLGAHRVFVIGPMCTVNRVSSEPPCHLDCAEYSVKACPFLSDPKRRRRERNIPEGSFVAGEMIKRNPGVTCLWSTRSFKPFRAGAGVLFELGEPTRVTWWTRGRHATRDEVVASLESGMPILRDAAKVDGDVTIAELERAHLAALKYLPA